MTRRVRFLKSIVTPTMAHRLLTRQVLSIRFLQSQILIRISVCCHMFTNKMPASVMKGMMMRSLKRRIKHSMVCFERCQCMMEIPLQIEHHLHEKESSNSKCVVLISCTLRSKIQSLPPSQRSPKASSATRVEHRVDLG